MFPLHPVHLLERRWDALHGLGVEILTRDPQRALELQVTRRYVKAHGRCWYVFSEAALLLPLPRLRLFQRRLRRDARQATARELETLLRLGWREQRVGLWLIAAGQRVDLRNRLAEMAAEDEHRGMAGLGPAAACLGEDQDAETLVTYLRVALPRGDEDGPRMALAALLHLDDRLDAHRAQEFLAADGPWEHYAGHVADPDDLRRSIAEYLDLFSGGRPTSRAELIRNGTYPPGWRGWHLPPFF
jgi:hypothetical protein